MAANSKIEWCHHTFSPWEGCVKVSPECDHCYAEARDNRMHNGSNWGKDALRLYHVDAYWKQPHKWNRAAEAANEPARVFCGSLCDVAEDRRDLDDYRRRVQELIASTPWLRWLLLSKRPQNFNRLFEHTMESPNVWAGTTVGVRSSLWRIDALREVPAPVRFLSVEPLLEDLGTLDLTGIHWVIVGGESGRGARPMDLAWVRSIVAQCKAAGVACFVKQLGARPIDYDLKSAMKNDAVVNVCANRAPWLQGFTRIVTDDGKWLQRILRLKDKKGGDTAEWPHDLRVRDLPAGQGGA